MLPEVRLPGRSRVFMDTESVGSRRTHLNILVWRGVYSWTLKVLVVVGPTLIY